MGKTNPLNENDLEEFVNLQKSFVQSSLSWNVEVSSISKTTWDLSVKNPSGIDQVVYKDPKDIIAEIEALDAENHQILQRIKGLL